MKKSTHLISGIAILIFAVSFFLPGRITNTDTGWVGFLTYMLEYNSGYQVTALLFFPFIVITLFSKRLLISLYLSVFLILTQIDWFEYSIQNILDGDWSNLTTAYWFNKYLLFSLFALWLIFMASRKKSWKWYLYFLSVILFGYFFINELYCTVEFIADMGIVKNDIALWFHNCAMFYAWYTSLLMINLAVFVEVQRDKPTLNPSTTIAL